MSTEGDTGGQPSSTTISTVAVQAGDSRLIVAVLKCGPLLQLQLAESTPNLLEIGSNQNETKKQLEEHYQLLASLKKNEQGVWGLLSEADKVAQCKKNEADVHVAMARTLSDAWRTLISQLEKRRSLLHLASDFFDRALEFAIKIDEAEDIQHTAPDITDADCLKGVLQKHNYIKKCLLEKSLLVLNASQDLLDFLKEFLEDEAPVDREKILGAHNSCEKVESLMEILQDRRRQVNRNMKQQYLQLEIMHRIYQWDQQEQEAIKWYKDHAQLFLEKDQLGSTLSETEEILRDYYNFQLKAKDWSLLVERLLMEAAEILASEDCTVKGHMEEKTHKLKFLHDEFWKLMTDRQARLLESHQFFSSANKAFDELAGIENDMKGLQSQMLSLPELAKKQEELLLSAKAIAAEPLQQGERLLNDAGIQSTQVGGVERMMGYIREQVESLSMQCHAHSDLAHKRQLLETSFEDLLEKVTSWIKSSNSALCSNMEPGRELRESEDVLNKHLQLSSQNRGVENELEAISELIEALKSLESPEAIEFSSKASLLSEELKTLSRNIAARTEILKPYVSFLRSAEEVDKQMNDLQEYYTNGPEAKNDEGSSALKVAAEAKWQTLLERFLVVQDLGNNFTNTSNMASGPVTLNVRTAVCVLENTLDVRTAVCVVENTLDVRTAVCVVENTLDDLMKKKTNLTELWTSWLLQSSQVKSVKLQWKKFKEQLKKTVHNLNVLEDILTPAASADLGSDVLTVSKLQEHFNLAKPQIVKLNAEVEYMMKISEMLVLKGIPVKEKNERVAEVLHVHQRVKDRIREYESILNKAVKFHLVFNELENLLSTEPVTALHNISLAKIRLTQHQERQERVRHLRELAVSLVADITSTVMQSPALGVTANQLEGKLERLETGGADWSAEAGKCEESLASNVHLCIFKEESSELRESFKDLKKKFNNLKFNYMKKPEKSRNVRAAKNQIQQIEMFIEKLQALKKRMQRFTVKISANTENHPKSSCPREIEDAINELHKQLGEFDNVVEEYKHNLDMTVKLQQAMEEYQFWCDDASATIVRVGKYSSECRTTEAVSTLYKQFEKFVWPTIPQQEDRISQITELAVRLHGPEEGKKFVEKTVARHNEIVESIKELSNGLMDLEAKLQGEALKEQPDRMVLDGEIKIEETGHEAEGAEMSQESVETEPELKESGHTPENTNDDGKPVKKTIERFDYCKHNSQNFPDKLPRENQVMSELSSHSQGEFSEISSIKTITSRSVMEITEQSNTLYCNTQTFDFSSPAEKNTETHNLSQTENPPPVAPPHATSFSDIQREFRGTDSAQKVSVEKVKAFHELQVPSTDAQGAAQCAKEESFSQDMSDAPLPPGDIGRLAEGELFIEESLSYDEYECASPDDISLPPLSETPESNIIQSENDFDERLCSSSHCQHVNQCSQQSHSQFNDATRQRTSNQAEDLSSPSGVQGIKFRAESSSFVRSPLTVSTPTVVSTTLSSILKCKSTKNLPPPTLSKCHQTVYTVHESFTETQECVHDPNQSGRMSPQANNMHAAPFPLTSEQVPDICKPKTVREEIRLMSGSQASSSPTGRAPNFTKGLSNATVMEGSPVTLEVEVTGFPEPTVTWYRNGQNLTSDEDIELSRKEGNHTLFIQMVKDSDKGLYVVRAINSSGTVTSSAMLAVKRYSCRSVASALKLDWLSCFGILCVLLWLLYLLLL